MEVYPTESSLEIVLGIPGSWPSTDEIGRQIIAGSEGLFFSGSVLISAETAQVMQLEVADYDPNLRHAFELSAGEPHSQSVLDAIDRHTFTLYLIGEGGSLDTAQNMMDVAAGLLKAGGLAVKVESAGTSHSAQTWMELAGKKNVLSLFEAYVTLVKAEGEFYSCGMHNLGLRDVSVPGQLPAGEAARLLQGFLQYMLFENPPLETGQTFSLDDRNLYQLIAEPCTTYTQGDLLHNPFGIWRLAA